MFQIISCIILFLVASVVVNASGSIISSSSSSVRSGGDDTQVLRIVRTYANGIFLHCPVTSVQANDLAGVYQLKWINEKETYNKHDEQLQVNEYNLLLTAEVNLQVNPSLSYVSCGYVYNYRYVRIKLWQLVFIGNYFFLYFLRRRRT